MANHWDLDILNIGIGLPSANYSHFLCLLQRMHIPQYIGFLELSTHTLMYFSSFGIIVLELPQTFAVSMAVGGRSQGTGFPQGHHPGPRCQRWYQIAFQCYLIQIRPCNKRSFAPVEIRGSLKFGEFGIRGDLGLRE